MGKAKGGKKLGHDDDLDDEVDVEIPVKTTATKTKEKKGKSKTKGEEGNGELIDDEDVVQNKKTKGKKDKKKKGDDDEDNDINDLAKSVEDLSVISTNKKDKKQQKSKPVIDSGDEDDDDDEDKKPAKKEKKKKKKGKQDDDSESENEVVSNTRTNKSSGGAKKGGFALLAVSDEDEPEVETNDQQESDSEVIVERTKDTKKEKGNKKGKKKKKKADEDEEDIEKMLAELQMEYSGVPVFKEESIASDAVNTEEPPETDKKKKKKKKAVTEEVKSDVKEDENDGEEDREGETGTVKTAAQKKKEKKEREKQKKLAAKKQGIQKQSEDAEGTPEPEDPKDEPIEDKPIEADEDDEGDEDDKKKKKKKKKGKEEVKEAKKGPAKKTIVAMQEALKKLREEEERLVKEEEERIRKIEEAEKAKEEQLKLEQERKEKKKQREKERKERLKAEGKLLTTKQKADRARAQATLEALKAQGLDIPDATTERKPRPGTRIRPKKNKPETGATDAAPSSENVSEEKTVEVQIVDTVKELTPEETVKDSWDLESSGEDEDKSEETLKPEQSANKKIEEPEEDDEEEESTSEEESSSEEEDSEDSSSEEEQDDRGKSDAQKKREKALARIQKRREDAEKKKSLDELRAAVVCVLGHVDTGKTKILDKLRRTNVQDGEAGGITQQIGATNVPIEAIKEQTKIVKGFAEYELKIPGLLIIDTPGHESFSNLRNRGSSLCDIAILVVDIMHGLEPQTIESINLLKSKKTPFIVALNKIDRLYDWNTMARRDVRDIIKAQAANTQLEFEQRTKEAVLQFAEQGLNAALFYDNPDPRSYVSLVPTSAITGEGMGNLLALIVQSCQTMLAKRLMFCEELQATVLEVKAIPGLGTTIDAILVNGFLREGDTMLVAGTDGPIVTQIRSLLMPQPLKELRVKNAYVEYKEIKAAQGVKIAAKDLEKAIAGLNLQIAQKPDEVEIFREIVAKELRSALSSIKLQERGVYVQASTLGSLEALLEFLRTSKIPYSNIRIGPVVKKDVMKASTMLEHESQYATILAFDVKIEKDAQDLADTLGVKVFQADIIYHLFDKFMAYREELRQKKRDEFKHIAVFPCKLKVLPQFIFNSRDPIVMGVMVEGGIVKEGTPICVPSREFVDLGIVTSIENNHKNVDSARKGQEVCIKIEPIPGEAPKMFGRHFDEKDFLISKISRQSIDACKDYFRDDLLKTDWQLMVELKKLFQIL